MALKTSTIGEQRLRSLQEEWPVAEEFPQILPTKTETTICLSTICEALYIAKTTLLNATPWLAPVKQARIGTSDPIARTLGLILSNKLWILIRPIMLGDQARGPQVGMEFMQFNLTRIMSKMSGMSWLGWLVSVFKMYSSFPSFHNNQMQPIATTQSSTRSAPYQSRHQATGKVMVTSTRTPSWTWMESVINRLLMQRIKKRKSEIQILWRIFRSSEWPSPARIPCPIPCPILLLRARVSATARARPPIPWQLAIPRIRWLRCHRSSCKVTIGFWITRGSSTCQWVITQARMECHCRITVQQDRLMPHKACGQPICLKTMIYRFHLREAQLVHFVVFQALGQAIGNGVQRSSRLLAYILNTQMPSVLTLDFLSTSCPSARGNTMASETMSSSTKSVFCSLVQTNSRFMGTRTAWVMQATSYWTINWAAMRWSNTLISLKILCQNTCLWSSITQRRRRATCILNLFAKIRNSLIGRSRVTKKRTRRTKIIKNYRSKLMNRRLPVWRNWWQWEAIRQPVQMEIRKNWKTKYKKTWRKGLSKCREGDRMITMNWLFRKVKARIL